MRLTIDLKMLRNIANGVNVSAEGDSLASRLGLDGLSITKGKGSKQETADLGQGVDKIHLDLDFDVHGEHPLVELVLHDLVKDEVTPECREFARYQAGQTILFDLIRPRG